LIVAIISMDIGVVSVHVHVHVFVNTTFGHQLLLVARVQY